MRALVNSMAAASLAVAPVAAASAQQTPARQSQQQAAGANCRFDGTILSDANCSWALPQGDFQDFSYRNIQACLQSGQRGRPTNTGLTCTVGRDTNAAGDVADTVSLVSRRGPTITFTRVTAGRNAGAIVIESVTPTSTAGRNHRTALTNFEGREIIVRNEARGTYLVATSDHPFTAYCPINERFAQAMNAAYASSVVTVGYDRNYRYADACRPSPRPSGK